ncbi:DUF4181 domain-containing protein [Bacillus sp. KH172YL63]|uniref:DUF4181 domain-containing protein n=1 Tax=Bacillus sp. KH172YL63 TaxID=2709784 RepID=UPI0013E436FA|nr:DUF4181 domain-containing protein [Bacillus sp. KH172YL63]BCB05133.1 hypothetical protein KH172YL63_32660 [Bacillus sp. KH172YL63]
MYWLKYMMTLLLVLAVMRAVKPVLRKWLGLKNEKWNFFRDSYVNQSHRNVDKWLRRVNGMTIMTLAVTVIYSKEMFFIYWTGFITLLSADYVVRVFFEWKQSDYPKEALLTLMEMVVMLAAVFIGYHYWYV